MIIIPSQPKGVRPPRMATNDSSQNYRSNTVQEIAKSSFCHMLVGQ